MLDNSSMLSPCPFSRSYKIPTEQAWFLLRGFNIYRLLLAGLLLVLYYSPLGKAFIEPVYIKLYLYTGFAYCFMALLSWIPVVRQDIGYATQAQVAIFTDIFLLTMIMHFCGGLSSGVGALMLISTAAGGILIGGRCAMLFAAIASLFIFAEQAYSYRIGDFKVAYYPYAGMLGASFFSIALLAYILAKRTELIATQQTETIVSLEELNQYIIQNMQSGIIITDREQTINRYNKTCPSLLGRTSLPDKLVDISTSLASAFRQWLVNPMLSYARISIPGQADVNVSFASLPTRHQHFFMLTLEDVALYNQRVQQSMLASLGKLTANIAHEIRNPLGAISHAGQLLAESPVLSAEELRLTEIIQKHALRMNLIIEEILQLSRRNDSKRERISLEAWLASFLHTFEYETGQPQKQFHLTIEASVQDALCDPGHLTQILNNLCENALKYGFVDDKKIQIKVSTFFRQPCIDIIDFGKGVSESSVKHLFEPFFTTSSSGTGLGLYISRELAELNQAMLSYHRLPNEQGCYFRLCLANAE